MCYIKINKTNHILSNGAVTKCVYGRGLIGEESGSTFKTYHFDFRGSTVAITDGSGIHTELLIHWILYKLGIMKSSTKEAHMGGLKGNGYDSNAWVFELLRTDTKVAKLNANNALAHTALLRKIARCL